MYSQAKKNYISLNGHLQIFNQLHIRSKDLREGNLRFKLRL